MKIILERSESVASDLEYRPSDEEGEGEKEETEDEGNPLTKDILRYRMLYAKGIVLTSSSSRLHHLEAMWSLLKNIGQTLRLLAPAALLAVICGRDSPVIKFFQQFDRALRNALFPPEQQTDAVLHWLQTCLPEDSRITSLDAVWTDTSIICDLINSVIPGACAGHEDEEASLLHAQRLVEQYLGVSPIFSEEDISHKELNTFQECRLSHYMCCIRDVINQMTPPVSRAGTPHLNAQAYTLDYVARGMGIVSAYKDRKASFYIYPTAQQSLEPGDISVQIRGPGICFGHAIVPVIYGKAHIVRNTLLNLTGKRQSLFNVPLPITQGCSYIRDYDTSVQSKYFVPKLKNEIDIKVFMKKDKVKVSYFPTLNGHHEISLISKGCHIIGSPFHVNIEVPLAHKEESVDFTDDEVSEPTTKLNRKVVFSVVDFVTEKMILMKNGLLKKISDEDADLLLESKATIKDLTDKYIQVENKKIVLQNPDVPIYTECKLHINFKGAVMKIVTLLRICREFKKRGMNLFFSKQAIKPFQVTPDLVNFTSSEKIDFKQIENEENERKTSADDLRQQFKSRHTSFNATTDKSIEEVEVVNSEKYDVQIKEIDPNDQSHSESDNTNDSNASQDLMYPKVFRTGASIDIVISSFDDDVLSDEDEISVPESLPPIPELYDEVESVGRPKTPLLKVFETEDENVDIKTIENEKRKVELEGDFSLDYYINNDKISSEINNKENIIITRSKSDDCCVDESIMMAPSINFLIGEPVTPTKLFNNTTVEPDMDSIILAPNLEEALVKYNQKIQKTMNDQEGYNSDDSNSSDFMTPLRQTPFEQMTDSEILRMYEETVPNVDNEKSEKDIESELSSIHDFNVEKGGVNIVNKQNITQRRLIEYQHIMSSTDEEGGSNFNSSVDTWDSAYISIDEVNSSPDSNKSTGNNRSPKAKLFPINESSQENYTTPTWELLNGDSLEENESWKNRVNCEIQKEKEFNIARNRETATFYSKSVRTQHRSISVIEEDVISQGSPNIQHFKKVNNIFDFSASDCNANVKKSPIENEISTFQKTNSEMNRENVNLYRQTIVENNNSTTDMYNKNIGECAKLKKKRLSKMVSEKRDYWDNKIKSMQTKENKKTSTIAKKRTAMMKRNDSLNRKRGKQQILNKSQNLTEIWKTTFEPKNSGPLITNHSLVARWKTYWDEKVENIDKQEHITDNRKLLKNIHNLYNSEESSTTPDDNIINCEDTTKLGILGRSKEIDDIYHACNDTKNENKLNNNVLGNKYQPKSINLQSITERIERFLESLPTPSPANDIEDVRFQTPEPILIGGNVKKIKIIDTNNNKMNNEKILKIDQDKDKLKIIWNDCQSRKRLEALQLMSDPNTPDVMQFNSIDFMKDTEMSTITKETEEVENTEESKGFINIYEKENLTSYPIVSKMKAEIESINEELLQEITKKNFLKYRSKTFDDTNPVKKKIMRKSQSVARIQRDLSKSENCLNLIKTNSIADLRRTFEQRNSIEKINLNISTESIPSMKNRKLRLENYLQLKVANMEVNNDKKVTNVKSLNKINKITINRVASEVQEEEIVEFKPISHLVKSFENILAIDTNKKDEKEIIVKENISQMCRANEQIEAPGRILTTVAEKGEGTQEYKKQDTFLLANDTNHGEMKTIKSKAGGIRKLSISNVTESNQSNDINANRPMSPADLDVIKFEYKDRFQKAKNFFQQLDKKQTDKVNVPKKKLNECEMLLMNVNEEKELSENKPEEKQSEDNKNEKNMKVTKRCKVKAFSTASDTEYEIRRRAWSNAVHYNNQPKLGKVSEKFLVEGLFKDIIGESSTGIGYGFKGIPHKNAVLAAFKSMEDVSQVPSSYEITVSQMEDFAKKNGIVNAQTYHSEFPHLPLTEPNKYRSRYDAVASGMFQRDELLKSSKIRRRYSEPNRERTESCFVKDI